jgi:hypothetical protein
MRFRILLLAMICYSVSGHSSERSPDVVISGRVLQGKCIANACASKSYLIEALDVKRKPQGLADAKIGIVSACGPENLELGNTYSFGLSIHDLSRTVLEQDSHGDTDAQDAELMRLCQFTLTDVH